MSKILIVDDAAFMRMMIKDSLKKGGYTDFIAAGVFGGIEGFVRVIEPGDGIGEGRVKSGQADAQADPQSGNLLMPVVMQHLT